MADFIATLPYAGKADCIDRQTAMLDAITHVAATMMAQSDWRTAIDDLLARLGQAVGAGRVRLFEVSETYGGGQFEACWHEWTVQGLLPLGGCVFDALGNTDNADPVLADWAVRRARGEMLHIQTRNLPDHLRQELDAQSIHAHASVPIMVQGHCWGYLSFDDCHRQQGWAELELNVLRTAATLVAGAVERGLAGRGLRASEALKAAMLDTALDGIIIIDELNRIREFNAAAETIFGFARADVLGRSLSDVIIPPHLRARHEVGMEHYLMTGQSRLLGRRVEIEGMRADGTMFPLELTATEVAVEGRRFFTASLRDITDRRRAEEKLIRLAYYDPATNLPNRALLLKRMDDAVQAGGGRWVIALDFSHFGLLKAGLGSEFGDQLLSAFAARIGALLGPGEELSRIGDQTFAVLGRALPDEQAFETTRRILAAFERPFELAGRTVFQAIGCGIAIARDGADSESLLRDAEMACHGAIKEGSNRIRLFDSDMRAAQLDRMALESDLRHALKADDQIWIAYQPIVTLCDHRLAGFEALVRWRHPVRGELPPNTFIPIAEVTGLIVPLGRLVLEQACHQMAVWQSMWPSANGPLMISVNLSPQQLEDPELVPGVRDVLASSGIDPASLKLEITESMVVKGVNEAVRILNELKSLGLRLSIDDFGTGYSSLSYLHRLPADTLKVDRSFVQAMPLSTENREMVRIIIDLARALHMDVVAEGIETVADAAALADMACDYGQGFHFSRPLPAAAATALVAGPPPWRAKQSLAAG